MNASIWAAACAVLCLGAGTAAAADNSSTLAAYQKAVARQMPDPEATRFEGGEIIKRADGSVGLCGLLNTKNRFGGYGGFHQYYADIIVSKNGFVFAVPWLASPYGTLDFTHISEKCSVTPRNQQLKTAMDAFLRKQDAEFQASRQ